MKKHLSPVRNFLKPVLRELNADSTQAQWRDYQQLLYSCMPPQWRSKVLLGARHGSQWQLWVENSSNGYQLRFLLSEVEAMLSKKLPHPPQLRVCVRADIWAQMRRLPQSRQLYPRRYYDMTEAEAVINGFVDELLRA